MTQLDILLLSVVAIVVFVCIPFLAWLVLDLQKQLKRLADKAGECVDKELVSLRTSMRYMGNTVSQDRNCAAQGIRDVGGRLSKWREEIEELKTHVKLLGADHDGTADCVKGLLKGVDARMDKQELETERLTNRVNSGAVDLEKDVAAAHERFYTLQDKHLKLEDTVTVKHKWIVDTFDMIGDRLKKLEDVTGRDTPRIDRLMQGVFPEYPITGGTVKKFFSLDDVSVNPQGGVSVDLTPPIPLKVQLRYGRFGAYFHEAGQDLDLQTVLTRLNNGAVDNPGVNFWNELMEEL